MLQISQQKQIELTRQYQQATLPHAIIIQGVEGAGKNSLATWLIDLLICQSPSIANTGAETATILQACGQCKACLLNKSDTYPDHLTLLSENKTLGVDDVRRGNSFLEKTAHLGQVKTILIPNAQILTVAAANALLKTLEEPSQNSYIVLLTEDLDSLLPTIVSRCAVYVIRAMVGEALLAEINSPIQLNSVTNEISNTFVNLTQLPELTDNDTFKAFKAFDDCYLAYLFAGKHESDLLDMLADNKHSLRWLEKVTCNLVRQYHIAESTDNSTKMLNQKVSISVLNQIYQAIIQSNKLIKSYTQANRQFVIEQLIMTINNIVRPLT